jgi:hypothetical protein
MTLKEAKQLFEEIVELCYQTGNPHLIETIVQIYPEVEDTTELSRIILSAEELQVVINDMDILDDEEDDVQEIQEIIERLSE